MYSLFLLVFMTKRIPIHVHNLVKQRTIPSITTLENTPNIATIKLFSFLVNAAITLATILKNNAPSSISVQIPAMPYYRVLLKGIYLYLYEQDVQIHGLMCFYHFIWHIQKASCYTDVLLPVANAFSDSSSFIYNLTESEINGSCILAF